MKKIIVSAFAIAMALGMAQDGYGWPSRNNAPQTETLPQLSDEKISQLSELEQIQVRMEILANASTNLLNKLKDNVTITRISVYKKEVIRKKRLFSKKTDLVQVTPATFIEATKAVELLNKSIQNLNKQLHSKNKDNVALNVSSYLDDGNSLTQARVLIEKIEEYANFLDGTWEEFRAAAEKTYKAQEEICKVYARSNIPQSELLAILAGRDIPTTNSEAIQSKNDQDLQERVSHLEKRMDALERRLDEKGNSRPPLQRRNSSRF